MDQHTITARADAARQNLAKLDQEHRHQATRWRGAVDHRIHRAAARAGGRGGADGGKHQAEAEILIPHVTLRGRDAGGDVQRIGGCWGATAGISRLLPAQQPQRPP